MSVFGDFNPDLNSHNAVNILRFMYKILKILYTVPQ